MDNNVKSFNTDNSKNQTETTGSTVQSPFESLVVERELADYAKDQIIYAGLFIDPDSLYDKFPPNLSHRIRDPHVTTAYRPSADKVFLNSLGSSAKIRAIAYGNNGENEGLLVEVSASDPTIQKTLVERVAPDRTGEVKTVPMHITLSIAEGAEAVNTKYLDYKPLETPLELTGNYKLFRKDGVLISDKDTIREMQSTNFSAQEVEDPDRL